MYQLIRATRRADLVRQQGPVLAVSLLIAELFYKFHSFTLECTAFLATWFALDLAVSGVRRQWPRRAPARATTE